MKLKSSSNTVIFLREYHPAEIEFDKCLQLELVKYGKALEELKKQINTFSQEQAQQICSGYNRIISLLNITSFDGYGFAELYQIMSDNKFDIKTAASECSKAIIEKAQKAKEEARKEAERRQAEEKRKKYINEIYSKQGDVEINRYTDAIISDIYSKLDLPYPVYVYGGSTFSEWNRNNELNELKYPNILVKDIVKFSFEHKTYRTEDPNGNYINRPFNTEVLPINYGFQIEIHAKNKEQLAEIKHKVKALYSEPKSATVALPLHDGERFHVGIYFARDLGNIQSRTFDSEIRSASDGITFKSEYTPTIRSDVFCETLSFHEYQSVYFVRPYKQADLDNNRKLQINLLRLAVFYGESSNKLAEAAKSLSGSYKVLISGKNSFLSFLGTQEFKMLKNCYDCGMPLDRNLFDSVFNNIVCVYPYPYNKTIQRIPIDIIEDDIRKYSKIFNDKFVELVTMLGVPTQFKRFSGEIPYLFTNLRAYAGRMDENPKLSLDEAIDSQEEERIEADRIEREKRAEREYHESDYSDGYELFSSLFNSVKNNSLNREHSYTQKKRSSDRQSLWGTAMCPYGRRAKEYDPKSPDFATINCNIGCPLWSKCGGK